MGIDYDRTDPSFIDDLCRSDLCTRRVVAWLRKRQYPAIATTMEIRPDPSKMSDYADRGDIRFFGQRFEAKQRMLNFTSKETFPYPTVIVDAAHCWDKSDPKPSAYFLTNKDMTCMLIVRASTSKKWSRVERWDRFKNRSRIFYECPLELAEFRELDVTDAEVSEIPTTIPREYRESAPNAPPIFKRPEDEKL